MFKSIKIFAICSIAYFQLKAQSGCTDSLANNFDANAVINNGSCTYNQTQQYFEKIGSISGYLGESSGLVLANGSIWSHNDSGNPNHIFKVNPSSGKIEQKLIVTNQNNIDWEDITSDDNYLYIGDFGNNDGDRTDLRVLKIAKSQFILSTAIEVNVTAEEIRFTYADQTNFNTQSNHNFDCEGFFSLGDSLYLFTKNRGNEKTKVYHLSKDNGTYSIFPKEEFNVNGLITGADIDSTSGTIALIGYSPDKYNSFIWYLYDYSNKAFFSGNKRRVEIGTTDTKWQTEGIALADSNRVFISNENSYIVATLFKSNRNTDLIPFGVESIENTQIKVFPNPTTRELHIQSEKIIESISIQSVEGKTIFTQAYNASEINIQLDSIQFPKGTYFVSIKSENELKIEKLIMN